MRSEFIRHRGLVVNVALAALAVIVTVVLQMLISPNQVSAAKDEVCICHAAGQAGTTHFVTVCANRTAIYGQAGHFNEDGTPQAGHEDDYEGRCTEPSPPPDPSPTPDPDPSPSPGL